MASARRNTKDRGRRVDVFRAVHISQRGEGLDRAKERVGRGSNGDLVVVGAELVGLGLGDRDDNSVRKLLDVVPLEKVLRIERLKT